MPFAQFDPDHSSYQKYKITIDKIDFLQYDNRRISSFTNICLSNRNAVFEWIYSTRYPPIGVILVSDYILQALQILKDQFKEIEGIIH